MLQPERLVRQYFLHYAMYVPGPVGQKPQDCLNVAAQDLDLDPSGSCGHPRAAGFYWVLL